VEGDEGRHLLLIEWRDIADHRDRFAKSDAFRSWAAAIGPLLREPPRLTYHMPVFVSEM
jgi:quinol monooxygenase YgiN